jgi:hypothetical protein
LHNESNIVLILTGAKKEIGRKIVTRQQKEEGAAAAAAAAAVREYKMSRKGSWW